MADLTIGTLITPLDETEYTFVTEGPFRIDASGCSYHVIETLAPGVTKTHSEQPLSGIDFSGLFPVGTELTIVVETTDPLPEDVEEYLLVRGLG